MDSISLSHFDVLMALHIFYMIGSVQFSQKNSEANLKSPHTHKANANAKDLMCLFLYICFTF